jgi:TPR repeat protein
MPSHRYPGEFSVLNTALVALCLTLLLVNAPETFSQVALTEHEIGEATENYLLAAEEGNPNAQFMLYFAYTQGFGVEVDKTKALEWLTKSADNNHPEALFELGQANLYGVGVAQDEPKGVSLLQRAGDQGYAEAYSALGAYFLGIDRDVSPRNVTKAKQYLMKAAESGSLDAYYYLGLMYQKGLEPEAAVGDDLNVSQAVYWYTLAAKRGHLHAMAFLGEMNLMPIYGLNDVEQGFFLLKVASLAGLPEADAALEDAATRIDSETEARLSLDARELVESFQVDLE